MAAIQHPIASALMAQAADAGLNLAGFVGAAAFDACQPAGRRVADFDPECGTVLVLGHGGSYFWDRMTATMAERGEIVEEPGPDYHPVDTYSLIVAAELVDAMAKAGIGARVVMPDDSPSLNFRQLAEQAGWGAVSPVMGVLLHPQFGPWVSIRAALLVTGEPFGPCQEEEFDPFQPCSGCKQPCAQACPAGVFDEAGHVNLRACAEYRHAGGCTDGCAARQACPVGEEQAYGAVEESFRHSYSLEWMRRHFGLT